MRSIALRLLCLPVAAVLAGCTGEAKSPIVHKLETSELHQLGSFCEGAFITFDGKDLVMVDPDKGSKRVFEREAKFTDIGDDRVTISFNSQPPKIVFRFRLNNDKTLMTYEAVYFDPPQTPEALANAKIKAANDRLDRAMRAISPLVLCPKRTT
jgi:hypothetical protein